MLFKIGTVIAATMSFGHYMTDNPANAAYYMAFACLIVLLSIKVEAEKKLKH